MFGAHITLVVAADRHFKTFSHPLMFRDLPNALLLNLQGSDTWGAKLYGADGAWGCKLKPSKLRIWPEDSDRSIRKFLEGFPLILGSAEIFSNQKKKKGFLPSGSE